MFKPTQEQQSIQQDFNALHNIKIHAFAGTGKTTTLRLLAEGTERSGIYLAFNKRIAQEAKKFMPSNITSATMHSFAWQWAKSRFDVDKLLKSPTSNLIQQTIPLPTVRHFSQFKTTILISRIVQRFTQSNDKEPSRDHIPWSHQSYISDQDTLEKYLKQLVFSATSLWQEMKNENSNLPLGHDGYLKLWELSNPKIQEDFLFVDEAQDLNPVMQSVLKNYVGQIVVVGDSQQQIYEWRGATDAMQMPLDAKEHFLTHTFRFGSHLADAANSVLRRLKVQREIVSATTEGTDILTQTSQLPEAFLFRKNVSLIGQAIEFFHADQAFHIVDPNKNISETVLDYFRLNEGLWGKSQTFEGFNSWERVVDIAKSEDDTPFGAYVELFETIDPEEIKAAIESSSKKQSLKYPSLSTIHQAKGLEWENVKLANDFNLDFNAQTFEEQQDELRLLYVGLTRAKKTLTVSTELLDFCSEKSAPIRYAVIDLETTGLSPDQSDRITEVGVVILEDGEIVDRFQSLVNPERPIPYDVQELTGITDKMVAKAPSSNAVLSKTIEFIGDAVLVAHNASFEQRFLNNEMREIDPRNDVHLLCTMLLSRRIFSNLTSFKLGNLVAEFNLPKGQAHRALSDAEMTAHLFNKIESDTVEATGSEVTVDADTYIRITKVAPKYFRENGVRLGIQNALTKYAKLSLPKSVLLQGTNLTSPIASKDKAKPLSYRKLKATDPQTVAGPKPVTVDHPPHQERSLGQKIKRIFRFILLATNWLFFGTMPFASIFVVFDSEFEDKKLFLVIAAISLAIGWAVHRFIKNIFK